MARVIETYGKIGADEEDFDIRFWQELGPAAIFKAALELIRDAQILRHGHADEPRLQRAVEHFQRA